MRIIALKSLRKFWEHYPNAEQSIKAWMDEVKKAAWENSHQIKAHYRHAMALLTK